jgi:hypothetical protein
MSDGCPLGVARAVGYPDGTEKRVRKRSAEGRVTKYRSMKVKRLSACFPSLSTLARCAKNRCDGHSFSGFRGQPSLAYTTRNGATRWHGKRAAFIESSVVVETIPVPSIDKLFTRL